MLFLEVKLVLEYLQLAGYQLLSLLDSFLWNLQ
jgi:hypothetical protein